MHYSPLNKGFYCTTIHGENIPADAVEVSPDEYETLMSGQSEGKHIVFNDQLGRPVLEDPPAPSPSELILRQIRELEATITPRRLRESILGIDNGWLNELEQQITELRKGL